MLPNTCIRRNCPNWAFHPDVTVSISSSNYPHGLSLLFGFCAAAADFSATSTSTSTRARNGRSMAGASRSTCSCIIPVSRLPPDPAGPFLPVQQYSNASEISVRLHFKALCYDTALATWLCQVEVPSHSKQYFRIQLYSTAQQFDTSKYVAMMLR